MPRPLIALLTDFGLQDHYVGAMKGVILGLCPDAQLVDITHEISPQNILAAAFELDAAYRYFPKGTIFVVVIDPGVGSLRRALAVDTGAYRFVGPDNGVLSWVVADAAEPAAEPAALPRVSELTNPQYSRETISPTFEGRDRFAPAAAWLARGVDVAMFGPHLTTLVDLPRPRATRGASGVEGVVVRVDRFGNLMTNIERSLFEPGGAEWQVWVDGCLVDLVVSAYAEAPPGALCALIGSADRLEVAVNGGSAARRLGVGPGAAVCVRSGA